MWPSLEMQARQFAEERHGVQLYGTRPYKVHLYTVRSILASFGYHDAYAPAAWLHDVLEDTDTTREEIETNFGAQVAGLVWAVTGVGKNRKARNASMYEKVRALPDAAVLKLADRIANVEASKMDQGKLAMYEKEWPAFITEIGHLGDHRMWNRLRRSFSAAAHPADGMTKEKP